MAKEREITTKFKVDISELKAGIAEANRHIKLANSEFKAATAGMDSWSKSSEGLQAKIKQLNSVLDAERSKLAIMEEQYRSIAEECGESSKEAEEFKIKLNNQQAAVNKAEAELRKYTQKLDDLEEAANDAGDDIDRLGDEAKSAASDVGRFGDEAKSAGSGVDKLGNEAKQAGKGVDSLEDAAESAKKDVDALGDEAKDAAKGIDDIEDAAKDAETAIKKMGDGFTVAKGAVATFAGNVMSSLAGSIKNGISNLVGLAESTREYREDIGKLETAFASANVSTEAATKTYKDFYSVLGEEDRSVEAVNHLAKFVDTEEDMAKWTDICTGVWGTFGDSLPIEGLTEAANETMKTGSLTGVLADALNWAGVSEDDFQASLDACNNEQERQALITETLNGLYKDAAGVYRENNKSIMESRQATSDYQDTLAKLGEKMEPVTTAMTRGFTKILEKVVELVEGVDLDSFIDKIDKGFTYIADTVLPLLISGLKAFLPVLIDGIKWMIDNSGTLVAIISTIGTVVASLKIAAFIANIVSLIGKIKGVISGLGALKVVFTAMTGPVGIAVAAIGLIVTAFIALWKNSESFRNFWIGLWDGLKNVVSIAVDGIVGFFTSIVDFVKENWQGLLMLIVNPIAGAFKLLYDNCAGFREFWDNFFQTIKDVANMALEAIVGFFSSKWNAIKEAWSGAIEFFSNIWEGIKSRASEALQAIAERFSSAWTAIKNVWSVVVDFFKGIWEGITNAFSKVVSWFTDIFSKAWEAVKAIWEKVAPFFQTIADAIKAIFEKLGEIIAKIFELAWSVIKGIWNLAVEFFTSVSEKIKEVFSSMAERLREIFSNAWDKIKTVWNKAADFFKGISKGIKDTFSDVASWLGNKFGAAWEAIKGKFAGWGQFWSGLWTQLKDKFSGMGSNIGKAMSDSVIKGLNGVLGLVEKAINGGIKLINSAIKLANLLPGVDVGTLDTITLPRLEKGGILKKGQKGLLEGNGAEAVVPLDQNKKWIRKTAKDMNKELSAQNATNSGNAPKNVTNNYNFTQNNTSPKALSRFDIYRQTNNQLALLRG